jgi:hypothetical protein
MSQQEFLPESQSNQQDTSNGDAEIQYPQYPYSWSGKLNQAGNPRDEPPFNFDPTVKQQGDSASTNASPQRLPQPQLGPQYIPPGDNGDAYEQGYRPYNTYNYNAGQRGQGVPPWARPQRQRYGRGGFGFIILVLIIIGLLGAFAKVGFIAVIFSTIVGFVLVSILVPLIVALVILGAIVRMFRPRRVRYWRRGPWWF